MPWSVGQVTGVLTVDAAASGGISFGTAPNPGSTVVVLIANWANTASVANGVASVTDNQGNGSYNRLNQALAGNAFSWATIFFKHNVSSSGTFTVTVTGGDPSTNWAQAVCVEARPPASGSKVAVDLDAAATGTGTTASVDGGTTRAADEFVAAVMAVSSTQFSITGPAGYSERWEHLSGAIVTSEGGDKVRTSAGSESPSWTLTHSGDWAAVVGSLREAAPPALLRDGGWRRRGGQWPEQPRRDDA
jgi:hypothetical protein